MLRRGASLRQDHALRRCREPAAAPAQIGLAASFSRPGGNVTGIAQLVVAAEQKRLELLHKLVPTAKTIACLVNPTNPNAKRQVHDPVHARKFATVIMADPKSFAPKVILRQGYCSPKYLYCGKRTMRNKLAALDRVWTERRTSSSRWRSATWSEVRPVSSTNDSRCME